MHILAHQYDSNFITYVAMFVIPFPAYIRDWIKIAQILDANRQFFDAFLVVHGTDTMAYTASALSLLLRGFKKPIVLTGSQMPLAAPRSDARSNLLGKFYTIT